MGCFPGRFRPMACADDTMPAWSVGCSAALPTVSTAADEDDGWKTDPYGIDSKALEAAVRPAGPAGRPAGQADEQMVGAATQ